jgi:5-enolpyruvylshikimate-3-phosphate synthase
MASSATEDGIEVPGGQVPARPESPVQTYGDHRIAMTAMVLASKVGGSIVNPEISAVTDPGFIERLTGLGD